MKIPIPYIEAGIDPAASLSNEEKRSLSGELNSICICYTFLLRNLQLPKIKKIRLEFSDSPYANFGLGKPMRYSPMIGITKDLDFYRPIKTERDSQIRWTKLVKLINDYLIEMCKEFNYDELPFENVYKLLKSSSGGVVVLLDHSFSKNRRLGAHAQIKVVLGEVLVVVKIVDQSNRTVKEIPVVSLLPSLFFLGRVVGKLIWQGDSHVKLRSSSLGIDFEASLDDDRFLLTSTTSGWAKELGQLDLELMNPRLKGQELEDLLRRRSELYPK